MNKMSFTKKISEELNVDLDYAKRIIKSFDEYPMVGRENKNKIIASLIEELNISEDEADNIYNVVSAIAAKAVKDKLLHPFKKED